jgi:hypothetical protein
LNETSTNLDTVVKGFQRPTQKVAHILDFANARMIDLSYFTRNSVATYIDKNGVLRVASPNQPRFIHNAMTLESLGLLIEPSRTNLLTYSTDLSTWTRGGVLLMLGRLLYWVIVLILLPIPLLRMLSWLRWQL